MVSRTLCSASLTKNIRQDLKSHLTALEAAGVSEGQVLQLWGAVNSDIKFLFVGGIGCPFLAECRKELGSRREFIGFACG